MTTMKGLRQRTKQEQDSYERSLICQDCSYLFSVQARELALHRKEVRTILAERKHHI